MERRKSPRIVCTASGTLYLGSEVVACTVANISRAGLGLVCPRREAMGTFVRVTWHSFSGLLADADGVVVRCESHVGGGYNWGLSVIRLAPQVALEIDAHFQGFPVAGSKEPSSRPPRRDSSPYHRPSGMRPATQSTLPPRSKPSSGSFARYDPSDPLSQPPLSKRELHALYRAALAQQKGGGGKK